MSRLILTTALLAACAATVACKPAVQTGSPMPGARAVVRNSAGANLGTLIFAPSPTGIHITGALSGLPPGVHGIHLHAVGTCTAPEFTSAGGHVNPMSAHHGLENPAGPHAGDLPNIVVASDGTVRVDLTDPRVTLDTNPAGGLFDADGSAIVVHAGPDDQKTDPAGNSGARIACGVIERS